MSIVLLRPLVDFWNTSKRYCPKDLGLMHPQVMFSFFRPHIMAYNSFSWIGHHSCAL
jgi:hypothetical protein